MTINGINLRVGRYDEEYFCGECRKQLIIGKVNKETWRCDTCNEKLLIKIKDVEEHIARLLPSEVDRFDSVFNYFDYEFVELKGITLHDNKKEYLLGIAEYRQHKVGKDDFIDCMWRY